MTVIRPDRPRRITPEGVLTAARTSSPRAVVVRPEYRTTDYFEPKRATPARLKTPIDRHPGLEALKADPTGLFGPAPADGGLAATIDQVLDLHERGGASSADLNTAHFRTSGNALRVLVDTKYFDEGLFPAILEAKRSILIAALCFGDDALGRGLAQMLKEKLAQGVQVAIIADGYFGWDKFKKLAPELEAAGAQIFHTRFLTTGVEHRKACVVDGERAFLGGSCLEAPSYWNKKFRDVIEGDGIAPMKNGEVDLLPPHKDVPEWHDLQVEIRGPAAQQLAADMLLTILYHGGTIDPMGLKSREALREFWFPKLPPQGDLEIAMGQAVPLQRNTVQAGARAMVGLAKKSLYIHSAYLTSRPFFRALKRALERGVEVHLGMPGGFDSAAHHYAYRARLPALFAAAKGNLHIFEYEKNEAVTRSGYNHDKWIVVDEEYVWTSTGNPEFFSQYKAFDTSLTTRSKEIAGELIELFHKDAERSKEVTPETLRAMSLKEKVMAHFFGFMILLLDIVVGPLRARGEIS